MKVFIGALCLCAVACSLSAFRMPGSCTGPEDCESGECCVVGMQRYSVPRCEKLGQIGDTCRPYGLPGNYTLWYPHTSEVQENHDTYTLLCPCDSGLRCSRAQCQPNQDDFGNGLLNNYNDYE